ncbi:hypothetical protein F383_14644 [Gossypium arboreum]|uniref:Uncharacterized protein n=1 Tax=Gossypium arboreum TaxID=29729 RepID=A0A0B0Q1Q8_GOSAR|nr:hypothetical protein F383_20706 [Gossypium arboreum]KHG16824.1 hypothetical protein F383_00264 [Gossypium arboreum]KHG21843.1 hypothetical protein F383_04449 [Gossypium arboreum]KHG23963.1 hypothetical protein F383_30266 [Gossypium arboreum]KHG25013.1 hypothetical protein F383_31639 [Gossypium arboreum]
MFHDNGLGKCFMIRISCLLY